MQTKGRYDFAMTLSELEMEIYLFNGQQVVPISRHFTHEPGAIRSLNRPPVIPFLTLLFT